MLDALLAGSRGVWAAGEKGVGKTDFLRDLLDAIPHGTRLVLRLDAAALTPKALASDLMDAFRKVAGQAGNPWILLVIDDAERLRRDTLDTLDDMAGWLFSGKHPVQVLLVSQPLLAGRLTANGQDQLAACLTSRFTLADLSVPEARHYLDQALSGRAALPPRMQRAILTKGGGRPGLIDQALRTAAEPRPRIRVRAAAWWLAPGLALAGVLLAAGDFRRMAQQVERAFSSPDRPPAASVPAMQAVPDLARPALRDLPDASPSITPEPGPAAPEVSVPGTPTGPDGEAATSDQDASTRATPGLAGTPNDADSLSGPSRGLLLVAQPGDTLLTLYRRVYRGTTPPPFAELQAVNPEPVRSGSRVVFPAPLRGWVVR